MKKGDVVMIYWDPITEQKPEGKAKLLKLLDSAGGVQYWKVKFLADGMVTERTIKIML